MRKIFLVVLLMGIAWLQAAAQQDAKAESILNKMADTYRKAGGVSLSFGGTQRGKLLLKGDTPTPEELQSVNPYALLTSYKKSFNYRYVGEKTRQGKRGQEILLTPKASQDVKSITLNVKENGSPVYIAIQLHNGEKQEFQISSYQTGVNLPDATFRFNKQKYPEAEIIDLR